MTTVESRLMQGMSELCGIFLRAGRGDHERTEERFEEICENTDTDGRETAGGTADGGHTADRLWEQRQK